MFEGSNEACSQGEGGVPPENSCPPENKNYHCLNASYHMSPLLNMFAPPPPKAILPPFSSLSGYGTGSNSFLDSAGEVGI